MPSIQEISEVHGTAWGPGLALVQVDKKRGHHMVLAQRPKEPFTGLGVVVGHAEHVACRAEGISYELSAFFCCCKCFLLPEQKQS